MTISATNESKNSALADNFESKESSLTWDTANGTWNEEAGTWAAPDRVAAFETKNTPLADNFETKN